METATTDVCEWCKKPLLPPGASVTSKTKPGAAQPPPEAEPEAEQEEQAAELGQAAQAEAAAPTEAAAPPAEAAAPAPPSAETQPAAPKEPDEDVLRPLGHAPAAPGEPGAPSHGLADSATETSIDLDNYMGPGGSIFKPIERPTHSATSEGLDPLARRHRGPAAQQDTNPIADNIRMLRSLVTGLVISLPLAIIQFTVTHRVPDRLYFLPLGRSDNFITALAWGAASGVLLGGGLGALLVQFKRGPFLGLLLGAFLGMWGLNNPPYWGLIAGVLTGAVVGRHATVGFRRAMTV